MRYRVALCGFSEFEHRAMDFSFRHPTGFHESDYDLVDALSDADYAIVDSDSPPAVKGVLMSGRVGHAVFVGSSAPAGAASHLLRPIDPSRILRTLDALTLRDGPPTQPGALPDPGVFLPTLDDVLLAPPELPSARLPSALPAPATPRSPATDHHAAKVAARAAARRARQASERARVGALPPLRDVLVFDADPADSAALCALLQQFGFEPHAVASRADIEPALTEHEFAALFLDIVLDDPGVALLRRIRALPVPAGHAPPAVLMLASHLDAAERVAAALAGMPVPLLKPLARGGVARALVDAGVPLPSDARRT